MSTASKITLALALAASTGIVGYVHYKQTSDREKLHEGVLRDIERQQRRKIENTYILQKQRDLAKQLRDLQAQEDEDDDEEDDDEDEEEENEPPSQQPKQTQWQQPKTVISVVENEKLG